MAGGRVREAKEGYAFRLSDHAARSPFGIEANNAFRPVADLDDGPQIGAMGTKLSVEDAGAYEALDRLLFRQWDPIGVSDMDGWPEDEYRAYLPRFWSMIAVSIGSLLLRRDH